MTSALSQPAPPLANRPFPTSTLIICTRNRPQMLHETVDSILAAEEVPDELLIIDQSDAMTTPLDGLPNERGCEVRHLHTDKIGASYARNLGMQTARHEILVLIDDDMWVAPGWYGAALHALTSGGPHAVVTGKVAPAAAEKPDQFVIAVHEWQQPAVYRGRIGKDVLASGHMALYRSAFLETGGFDPFLGPGTRFPGAEDNDFGYRLLEAGYSLLYAPDSVVYHRAWRERRDYVPLFWKYGQGQGAFYAKHWSWRDPYMLSRAWKDLWRYLRLLPQRIGQGKLLVLSGATAFLVGEAYGALRWSLRWWLSRRRKQP